MKSLIERFKRITALMAFILIFLWILPGNSTCFQAAKVAQAATVKINKSKATIYVGETVALKITGTTKSITWKSSDKSIATVSKKGIVTGKKAGKVTITAKVNNKSYKCTRVVKKPITLVTDIITTSSSLLVPVNSRFAFNATVYPSTADDTLEWKSSNEKIVKVDEAGVCLAVAEGTAYIYATVTDGSGISAKWEISVNNDFSKRISSNYKEINLSLTDIKTVILRIPGDVVGEVFTCEQSNIILIAKWKEDAYEVIISPFKEGETYLIFTSNLYQGEYKIKVTVGGNLSPTVTASPTPTPTPQIQDTRNTPTPMPTTVPDNSAKLPTPTVTPDNPVKVPTPTAAPDNSAKIASLNSQISSAQVTLNGYKSLLAQYQSKLQKAQYDLERARNNKTILIYREDQGFVYEADPDAIRVAQNNVDYYQSLVNQYTDLITSKETEINALQAELNLLT